MEAKLERIAPVFAVRDVDEALALYRSLGFEADPYEEDSSEPTVYGFLRRDGVEIHLARVEDIDPQTTTSACYLFVSDADALYAEWRAAAPRGRLHPPSDTPYGLRELAFVDPDGNLIRAGSRLPG